MTRRHSTIPGFGLTLGFTLLYLSLIVLIPLATLPIRTSTMSWASFWATVTDPRVVASYRLSLGASLAAAAVNAVMGAMEGGRCAHRSPLRAPDGRGWDHLDHDLRAERVAGPAAG
jgi:ABC-type sulfate transport system permease subunit